MTAIFPFSDASSRDLNEYPVCTVAISLIIAVLTYYSNAISVY
ncbi:hypothetical protein Mpsy_2246 [Methanolobus psychrophilus R15]|nr:hypothetical protein Mpsy_2246 [Methanolobus psychrophilus R15]